MRACPARLAPAHYAERPLRAEIDGSENEQAS